jgi:hypothetical protein
MEFVVLWLLLAIFSALLAFYKNRSPLGWFLVGLLFGPFGFLVGAFPKYDRSVLIEKRLRDVEYYAKKGIPARQISLTLLLTQEDVRQACLKLLRLKRITKSECETVIETPITSDEEIATGLGRKCPFCAENIKKDAVVCRFCGRELLQPEQKVETA